MSEAGTQATGRIPQHVAIIMDGNNRWAKQRLLPGVAGHRAGMESVRAVLESCAEAGVSVLTLFAFSSENWRRPPNEVKALMRLFLSALRREVGKLEENGIALRIIGERSRFSQKLQEEMQRAEAQCAGGKRLLLQIAANYGGQWDITQAAQQLAQQVKEGTKIYEERIVYTRSCEQPLVRLVRHSGCRFPSIYSNEICQTIRR